MASQLGAVLAAALKAKGQAPPPMLSGVLEGLQITAEHERIAQLLSEGELRIILLGALAQRHAAWAELRTLAAALAEVTGARLGYLPEGGNAVGAALAGATPHRGSGGRRVARPGLDASEMLAAKLQACLLVGGIEPEDLASPIDVGRPFGSAEFVVSLTPYVGEDHLALSNVILPVAAFAETSGTWVNVEGRWQSVPGAAKPPGDARPAWKVLRVLGNLLGLPGFDYLSSEDIRDELCREISEFSAAASSGADFAVATLGGGDEIADVDMYRIDPIVRRSRPLQQVRMARIVPGGRR